MKQVKILLMKLLQFERAVECGLTKEQAFYAIFSDYASLSYLNFIADEICMNKEDIADFDMYIDSLDLIDDLIADLKECG